MIGVHVHVHLMCVCVCDGEMGNHVPAFPSVL